MTGTHHASRIIPSEAPTRMAIFWPSPVLLGGVAGDVIGPAEEVPHHRLVPLEAAGGDHHASAGSDHVLVVVVLVGTAEADADDPTVLDQQIHGPGADDRLAAVVEHALQQPADEGLAEAPLVALTAGRPGPSGSTMPVPPPSGVSARRSGRGVPLSVTIAAHSPSSSNEYSSGSSERPPPGFPPGCSGW